MVAVLSAESRHSFDEEASGGRSELDVEKAAMTASWLSIPYSLPYYKRVNINKNDGGKTEFISV